MSSVTYGTKKLMSSEWRMVTRGWAEEEEGRQRQPAHRHQHSKREEVSQPSTAQQHDYRSPFIMHC